MVATRSMRELAVLYRTLMSDRPVLIAWAGLVTGVLCVIVVYGISGLLKDDSALANWFFEEVRLDRDRRMGEIINYGLAFLAATLFLLTFLSVRSPMYLFLSVLMWFVWLDDSASYHEDAGRKLVAYFDLPAAPGLRPQETGELLAWSLAAVVLGFLLMLALRRKGPGDIGALLYVSGCFCILILCGVATDLVHMAAPWSLNGELSVLEDGGEIVGVAMITGLALLLAWNGEAYVAACAAETGGLLQTDAFPALAKRPPAGVWSVAETDGRGLEHGISPRVR